MLSGKHEAIVVKNSSSKVILGWPEMPDGLRDEFATAIDKYGELSPARQLEIMANWLAQHGMVEGKGMAKKPRHPADVIGNAVKVMRIAVGEEADDTPADDGKNKAAQELGRMGGKARAEGLSAKRRRERRPVTYKKRDEISN
jgi:hypothetical protein